MSLLYKKDTRQKKPGRKKSILIVLAAVLILILALSFRADLTRVEQWISSSFQDLSQKASTWTGRFSEKNYGALLRSINHLPTTAPGLQDLEFTLSRTIWQDPYLIFQASVGEKISDHYLMVLDIRHGQLHQVHKGYHSRFWIEDEHLRFLHIDQYYECPLDQWTSVQKIVPPDLGESSKQISSPRVSELPASLQKIDWSNLHQVLEGSFFIPGNNELLFISGREKGYFLALYSMHPDPFKLLWSELAVDPQGPVENSDLMFNFQQVMTHDLDGDDCQEVFINGAYAAWQWPNDSLVYLNLARSFKDQRIQFIRQDISSGELIRDSQGKVQLLSKVWWSESFLYNFSLDQKGMILSEEVVLPATEEEMDPMPLHQDYYSTGQNLSRASVLQQFKLRRYPELIFPKSYSPLDSVLSPTEVEYHRLRNTGLQRYAQKIEGGWNPFQDTRSMPAPEVLLTTWKRCFDIIPVRENQRVLYLALHGFSGEDLFDNTFMLVLYDQNFDRVIDSWNRSFEAEEGKIGDDWLIEPGPQDETADINPFENDLRNDPRQWYSFRFLLPLPGQSLLWMITPFYRSHQSHSVFQITSEGIKVVDSTYNSGMSYYHQAQNSQIQLSFQFTHLLTSWGDGGNGVRMEAFQLMDPSSYTPVSSQFPELYEQYLDQIYRQYYFFRFRQTPAPPFDPEKGLEFDILEAYEEIVYYGTHNRLLKLMASNET